MAREIFAYSGERGGRIVVHRLSRRGLFKSQGSVSVTGLPPAVANRPPVLTLHPSKRFLYALPTFDQEKDGYSYDAFQEGRAIPARKSTPIAAYTISPGGDLAPLPPLSVPDVLNALVAHPGGKWLYGVGPEGKLWVLPVAPDGSLRIGPKTNGAGSFTLLNASYTDDFGQVALTPDGRFLFNFVGAYSMEYHLGTLSRWRVGPDGRLTDTGAEWSYSNMSEPYPRSLKQDAGRIYFARDGKTAFMQGRSGLIRVCRLTVRGDLAPGVPPTLGSFQKTADAPKTWFTGYDPDRNQVYFSQKTGPKTKVLAYQITGPGRIRALGVREPPLVPLSGLQVFNAGDDFLYGFE